MQVSRNTRPPRILLANDDPSSRRMLAHALAGRGFEVTEAATGRETLDLLERQPPDAVVLDVELPDGLAVEIVDYLRKTDQEGSGGPAWVVTFSANRADAIRAYGPVGQHSLPRPFRPSDLLCLLEDMLPSRG